MLYIVLPFSQALRLIANNDTDKNMIVNGPALYFFRHYIKCGVGSPVTKTEEFSAFREHPYPSINFQTKKILIRIHEKLWIHSVSSPCHFTHITQIYTVRQLVCCALFSSDKAHFLLSICALSILFN